MSGKRGSKRETDLERRVVALEECLRRAQAVRAEAMLRVPDSPNADRVIREFDESVAALSPGRQRHPPGCAVSPASGLEKRRTHVYLRDGTKVVQRRDGNSCWLEVVPQARMTVERPRTSWDPPVGPRRPLFPDGVEGLEVVPPTEKELAAASRRLEKATKPYVEGMKATRGRRL